MQPEMGEERHMRRVILAAAFLAAACGGQSDGRARVADGSAETVQANTDYAPAFEGQTRAPLSRSEIALSVEVISEALASPWALEFLPDERVLVTEREGAMRIVSADGTVSAPIAGLPRVDARRQGGLLDVALSPDFANDRMVYWSYSEPRGGTRTSTSVARGRLSADSSRLENVTTIFRQEPAWDSDLHYGSRLVWDREGHLFVTLGERSHRESRVLAQSLDGLLGKTVRINADGSIPEDNPFVGVDGARPEIWSYGQRNIQGATLNPETGALWTIEHGPRGGDELNVPEAGKNYGWPVITYGIEYGGETIGDGIQQAEGMEQPIYYWDPVIAPSGMTFYQGDLFPWRGDLVIAGLRGVLVRLELDGTRVTGEEYLLETEGRLRDVKEALDGALWIVTDEPEGRLLRVTPAG
jgi:glucose/arabinose dehydrogenase